MNDNTKVWLGLGAAAGAGYYFLVYRPAHHPQTIDNTVNHTAVRTVNHSVTHTTRQTVVRTVPKTIQHTVNHKETIRFSTTRTHTVRGTPILIKDTYGLTYAIANTDRFGVSGAGAGYRDFQPNGTLWVQLMVPPNQAGQTIYFSGPWGTRTFYTNKYGMASGSMSVGNHTGNFTIAAKWQGKTVSSMITVANNPSPCAKGVLLMIARTSGNNVYDNGDYVSLSQMHLNSAWRHNDPSGCVATVWNLNTLNPGSLTLSAGEPVLNDTLTPQQVILLGGGRTTADAENILTNNGIPYQPGSLEVPFPGHSNVYTVKSNGMLSGYFPPGDPAQPTTIHTAHSNPSATATHLVTQLFKLMQSGQVTYGSAVRSGQVNIALGEFVGNTANAGELPSIQSYIQKGYLVFGTSSSARALKQAILNYS